MGLIPWRRIRRPLSDETVRATLPRYRARPNRDNLADPVRDRRRPCSRNALRSPVCVRKIAHPAELRLPGVTKHMAERFGPALARARHIC